MVAAFVIVGIVVVGFLVLIILAVTLPARYWGCDDKSETIVGKTAPGKPNSAAAAVISGTGQVFSPKQLEAVAPTSATIQGT